MIERLAAIGLVGNIIKFVDFSSKILSKTQQIYRSADGALSENIDTELVTNDLVKMSAGLRVSLNSCAKELLDALEKLKADGRKRKWKSVRKALRAVWSKEEIDGIQKRLSSFRDEINLHIVVDLR
ncbi:hypothetical protein BDD12DRAFT_749607 [Trichophaea hybrida]|nr:hypothetical protein BDD12DRAFT_749607 [Trichophaea hybrida]